MKIAGLLAAALSLGFSAPAGAATVVQTLNFFDSGLQPQPTSFQIDGFDASLGTLDSVTIDFGGPINALLTISNPSNDPYLYDVFTGASATFDVGGLTITDDSLISDGIVVPGQSEFNNLNTGFNLSASATSSDAGILAAFLSGTPITGQYSPILIFGCNDCRAPTDVLLTQLTNDYQFNVTYDYTPFAAGAVPEPATWAMLILGFGLAGATIRHARRRDLAAA